MKISLPTEQYRQDIVDAIISAVSQVVVIEYKESLQTCPTCQGLDVFCPTCNGNPNVAVTKSISVDANVRWKSNHIKRVNPTGIEFDGDALVIVSLTSLPQELVDSVTTISITGKKLYVAKRQLKGSPYNRVWFTLKEDAST